MIVELLLNVVYAVIAVLTAPINLPMMDNNVLSVITQYFDYLTAGITILNTYIDLGYLSILFGLVVLLDLGMLLYKFIIWFLKKIPVVNFK